jgi:hypothetical protein
MTKIEDVLRISTASPAGSSLDLADLSRYAPSGNGVSVGGLPFMPWGGPPKRSPGYALYEHIWDPFLGAPPTEPEGGVIYFGRHVRRQDLDAIFRILGVHASDTGYLAFLERAATGEIGRRGFATQLRFVAGFAQDLFGIPTKSEPQPLSIGDAIWRFMELEEETDLGDSLGGDGDWAYESLAFGFLVENSYRGVYRIWSRPWLCTK